MKHVILLLLTSVASNTHAFSSIFSPKSNVHPILKTFSEEPGHATDSPSKQLLDIQINVDDGTIDSHKMNINGLTLELHKVEPTYPHPKMPGLHGPHPQLSSGIKALKILKHGSFVSTQGTQYVPLLRACWEVVWRKGAKAGSLICGFDLDEDVSRNECTLKKGHLYLSFPIWTRAELLLAQLEKVDIEQRAKIHLEEKNAAMRLYLQDANPFAKALHYRNAAMAMSKYSDTGIAHYKAVPSMDEVMEWNNGESNLYVTTKGLAWTKDGSFHRGNHDMVGTALLNKCAAPFGKLP